MTDRYLLATSYPTYGTSYTDEEAGRYCRMF